MRLTALSALLALLLVGCDKTSSETEARARKTQEIVQKHPRSFLPVFQDMISSAEKGDAEAAWKVGSALLMFWTNGCGGAKLSEAESVRKVGVGWLTQAAKSGEPHAKLDLVFPTNGVFVSLTPDEVKSYSTSAFEELNQKPEKNAADALYLSSCYARGIGVDKDLSKGEEWFCQFMELNRIPDNVKPQLLEHWRSNSRPRTAEPPAQPAETQQDAPASSGE